MKKKGFTLVELLATLVLVGVLSTILIRVSVKKINETKEKGRITLINSIELAAKEYALEEGNKIENFNINNYAYIKLKTLVEAEKFNNSLVDPTTKKSLSLNDTVYVTRSFNGAIHSYYDINQNNNAKITLNGAYNIYIEKGNTFTDPGVVAKDSNGNNVTSSVVVSGTVDTNTVGNYVITYTYNNVSITRNVIVHN